MTLNYYTQNGNVYHQSGELVEPKNGIIELEIEGVKRRFITEKFINYLSSNTEIKQAKIKKRRVSQLRKKRVPKVKAPKKKRGENRCIPIISIAPDGTETLHKSRAQAAKDLGIGRVKIFSVVAGKKDALKGYRFKNVVNES